MVPITDEATYLGCFLPSKVTTHLELCRRLPQTLITWKRFDPFWKYTNCTLGFKLQVYLAAVRAKLLYGLEPPHLNASHLIYLDAIQLKGLRKHIFKILLPLLTDIIRIHMYLALLLAIFIRNEHLTRDCYL